MRGQPCPFPPHLAPSASPTHTVHASLLPSRPSKSLRPIPHPLPFTSTTSPPANHHLAQFQQQFSIYRACSGLGRPLLFFCISNFHSISQHCCVIVISIDQSAAICLGGISTDPGVERRLPTQPNANSRGGLSITRYALCVCDCADMSGPHYLLIVPEAQPILI